MDPMAGGTGGQPGTPEAARQQVQGPAILLVISGVVAALFWLSLQLLHRAVLTFLLSYAPPDQTERIQEQIASGSSTGNWVQMLFMVVGALFVLYAALQMRQLKNWPLSMAGAIVALVPCFACCCLGLPVGIWALVVLNKPEVRAAFT